MVNPACLSCCCVRVFLASSVASNLLYRFLTIFTVNYCHYALFVPCSPHGATLSIPLQVSRWRERARMKASPAGRLRGDVPIFCAPHLGLQMMSMSRRWVLVHFDIRTKFSEWMKNMSGEQRYHHYPTITYNVVVLLHSQAPILIMLKLMKLSAVH